MAGRRSDPGIDRPRARPPAQEGQFGHGRGRRSASLAKAPGRPPHAQLQPTARAAKQLDFPLNALAESLPLVLADVLLRQSQKPLSEHSLLCRDSPYPHLHEDIRDCILDTGLNTCHTHFVGGFLVGFELDFGGVSDGGSSVPATFFRCLPPGLPNNRWIASWLVKSCALRLGLGNGQVSLCYGR